MTWLNWLFAVWTAVSSTFLAGAAAGDVHSFAFALYVGGTVFGLLGFVISVVDEALS